MTKIKADGSIKMLSAFWRKGRKCFVPLTSEECSRAKVNGATLVSMGYAENVNQGGIACYRLNKAGQDAFLKASGLMPDGGRQ